MFVICVCSHSLAFTKWNIRKNVRHLLKSYNTPRVKAWCMIISLPIKFDFFLPLPKLIVGTFYYIITAEGSLFITIMYFYSFFFSPFFWKINACRAESGVPCKLWFSGPKKEPHSYEPSHSNFSYNVHKGHAKNPNKDRAAKNPSKSSGEQFHWIFSKDEWNVRAKSQ